VVEDSERRNGYHPMMFCGDGSVAFVGELDVQALRLSMIVSWMSGSVSTNTIHVASMLNFVVHRNYWVLEDAAEGFYWVLVPLIITIVY
jgi:hypothetical protein